MELVVAVRLLVFVWERSVVGLFRRQPEVQQVSG